jgi:hypothetical protein
VLALYNLIPSAYKESKAHFFWDKQKRPSVCYYLRSTESNGKKAQENYRGNPTDTICTCSGTVFAGPAPNQ